MDANRRFARFAWGVVAYNLLVILWGAFVRATGSGAGCGSHWPLCNGEVVPREPGIATLIELSHRLTSGLALLTIVVMLVWAFRAFRKGHPARLGAVLSMVLMLTEAAVGAGLVLFELVADNESVARALFMVVHLLNTFLLLAAMTLTAHWGGGGRRLRFLGRGRRLVILAAGLAGLMMVGASGAVAALGDTLYPASSIAEGFAQDISPTGSLLVRLRVLHPLIAVGVGLYLIFVVRVAPADRRTKGASPGAVRWSNWLTLLVFAQLALGTLNVGLLAPVALQLLHLLLADLLWIALVMLAAFELAEEPSTAAEPVATPRPALRQRRA